MEFLHLLLGDLHLLEAGFDLREGEDTTLLTLRDQRTELLELRDRSLVAE